ncbi:MAG TPA: response regulator transcription factor [Solirubrobacteraceae bacterium]|nr:response regulator transcription factor [Solirubrobacteraceae bacterium]
MGDNSDLTTRVVVGEDQPLFRAGVVHVLKASGFDVVAQAGDAEDLVRKARAHSPDLAVVDIQMPPNLRDDGLRAALEIRQSDPTISVLILSHFLEDRYALALLDDRPEGAGYLLKDRVFDVDSFVDAVHRVSRGGSVVDSEVVSRLVGHRRAHDPIDELTRREREVLGLMAEGKSNRGIAGDLVVTVSAVERHVTSIFATLGLNRDMHEHKRVIAVLRYLHRRPSQDDWPTARAGEPRVARADMKSA